MSKKHSPLRNLLSQLGVRLKPVSSDETLQSGQRAYKPLPGQSPEAFAQEMRELTQRQGQPERKVHKPLPGQSPEEFAWEIQALEQKQPQRRAPVLKN